MEIIPRGDTMTTAGRGLKLLFDRIRSCPRGWIAPRPGRPSISPSKWKQEMIQVLSMLLQKVMFPPECFLQPHPPCQRRDHGPHGVRADQMLNKKRLENHVWMAKNHALSDGVKMSSMRCLFPRLGRALLPRMRMPHQRIFEPRPRIPPMLRPSVRGLLLTEPVTVKTLSRLLTDLRWSGPCSRRHSVRSTAAGSTTSVRSCRLLGWCPLRENRDFVEDGVSTSGTLTGRLENVGSGIETGPHGCA